MGENLEITAEPGQPTITLKRVFDAPRQRVFEAWTKPEKVKRWYEPLGFNISDCKIDFREGGKWRVLLHAPHGQDHGFSGEYRNIVTPERLVQTFHYDCAPQAEAIETLDFVEQDGKTILTSKVLHTSVENRDRHIGSGMEEAAARILDRLVDHLQSHEGEAPGAINKDQMATPQQALAIPDRAADKAKWDWRMAAAALVVLTFAAGGLYWPLHQGAAARYVTETVGRGSVIRTVGGIGTINPRTMEQIGAFVSGKIDAVYCDSGVNVKAGQLCAKIDPRPYRTAIDREKADLALVETRLKKDQAYLARANAALEHSQILRKRGAISRSTLDKSRTAFEQAKTHTTLGEAEIVRRRTALQSAEIDLSHTEIVSLIDGTVVSRNVETGQMVGAREETPLFLVAPHPTVIQVDANVSTRDIGEIKLGDKASFTVDALPDRAFAGEVNQISQLPQIDQDVAYSEVVIRAECPDLSLAPGMRATVQIFTDRRDNVIRVPDQSLRYSANRLDAGEHDLKMPPGWVRLWILRNGKPTAIAVDWASAMISTRKSLKAICCRGINSFSAKAERFEAFHIWISLARRRTS